MVGAESLHPMSRLFPCPPALPGVYIGQNAAGGYSNLLAATEGWYSEHVHFNYGVSTNETTGHYTQVGVARICVG